MANDYTLYVGRPVSWWATLGDVSTWRAARVATIVDPDNVTLVNPDGSPANGGVAVAKLLRGVPATLPCWRPY